MLKTTRVYDVPGVLNIRDLGGYGARDGRVVAESRFIRSTAITGLGEAGVRAFLDLGVDCVIDLRSVPERERAPDIVEDMAHIRFEHVPMLDYVYSAMLTMGADDFLSLYSTMAEMYASLLANSGDKFRRVFELFADERYSRYLFHCTAGKDRTGVCAMLLLGLAGVGDEDIVADYALTDEMLAQSRFSRNDNIVPDYVLLAAPETMRSTLRHLKAAYGGAEGYLESIGVDKPARERILAKLLV